MSYSPASKLVYLPAIENCAKYYNYGVKAHSANLPPGPSGFQYLPGKAYGKVMAIQPNTGEVVWEVKTRSPIGGGMLSTAGGLVFTGDAEGSFAAYDATTGRVLWSYQTGSGIRAEPITYRLDGKQYIAGPSGMGGAVGGYTGAGAPWLKNYRGGDTLTCLRCSSRALPLPSMAARDRIHRPDRAVSTRRSVARMIVSSTASDQGPGLT